MSLMTIVAMWLIDRVGRRPLLLTGITGMILSLGVLGFVFRSGVQNAASVRVAVITLDGLRRFFRDQPGTYLLVVDR